MRLLNAEALLYGKLVEFIEYQGDFSDRDAPEYAILSHTWDKDYANEVSFSDMRDIDKARLKPGWKKIEFCCQQALEDGWLWVWIDTCCIDKTSSAELTEAINSMFNWYSQSQVCYVYLSAYTE